MTKLIEEGLSTAQIGQKPGPLNQTISQVVNAKGRFLKCDSNEDKSDKKANQTYCWHAESFSCLYRRSNLPQIFFFLSQNLVQSRALALIKSVKAEKGEEAAEGKFKGSRS